MKQFALKLIRFYQLAISPGRPTACRFVPSCSQYGYEAIEKHGMVKGGWLVARRLCRCHPLVKGGVDPVP
ncbi:MAG: membrane protein insertion efficiency factor YidD [Chloroflexi bacterium]|nr:membrane protein insertion efficiency factor YidD [Chloroflexota bacterium]